MATVEDLARDPKYNPAPKQPNHDALVDFLRQHFMADCFVEFYGCNDGDCAEPASEHLRLPVEAMRHRNFYFRVGSHYSFLFGRHYRLKSSGKFSQVLVRGINRK
jgi:hypothetical protein